MTFIIIVTTYNNHESFIQYFRLVLQHSVIEDLNLIISLSMWYQDKISSRRSSNYEADGTCSIMSVP